ncbi:hypothetical protein Droror1_Dr00025142 [Drosera rotundifolia]
MAQLAGCWSNHVFLFLILDVKWWGGDMCVYGGSSLHVTSAQQDWAGYVCFGPVNLKTHEAAPRIRTPASLHGYGYKNKDKEPWVGPGRLMQREKKKGHGPPLAGWAAGEEKGSNRLSLGPHVLVGPAKKRKGPFKPP